MRSNKKPLIASRAGLMAMLSLLAIVALSLPASAQKVNITNLTSDITSAGAFQDANLLNPWGMSISPTGPWWFSDNTSGLSTLYVASGQPQSLVVTIPPASGSGLGSPSGTVYNASTSEFKIHGFATPFLFCTEDGTISGWYAGNHGFYCRQQQRHVARFTREWRWHRRAVHNYIYVANFNAGTIEAYDGTFTFPLLRLGRLCGFHHSRRATLLSTSSWWEATWS